MPSLSEKQLQILAFIRRQITLSGQPPTVREIGEEVGLKSPCSVQKQLDTLERSGKIRRSSFKYRSIELIDENGECSKLQTQPLLVPLMGRVAGGAPIETFGDRDPELLPLPPGLVGRGDRDRQNAACSAGEFNDTPYFALEVDGELMRDAGISNGDWVIARRQRTAENGDIVIALTDKVNATVKRFYHEGKSIRLQPANDAFEPLITTDVEIVGRVTMAIKRF